MYQDGATALMYAVKSNNLEMVRVLLFERGGGANTNLKDKVRVFNNSYS